MPDLDTEIAEEIRHAVRRYLASRPSAACSMDMIQHGLRLKGLDASESAIEDELTYWIGLDPAQVQLVRPKHGSAKTWQITSAGRVAHDRGE